MYNLARFSTRKKAAEGKEEKKTRRRSARTRRGGFIQMASKLSGVWSGQGEIATSVSCMPIYQLRSRGRHFHGILIVQCILFLDSCTSTQLYTKRATVHFFFFFSRRKIKNIIFSQSLRVTKKAIYQK